MTDLEKAARAIANIDCCEADDADYHVPCHTACTCHLEAKAALRAIREPSPEVVEKARFAAATTIYADDDKDLWGQEFRAAFRAAIDAITEENPND